MGTSDSTCSASCCWNLPSLTFPPRPEHLSSQQKPGVDVPVPPSTLPHGHAGPASLALPWQLPPLQPWPGRVTPSLPPGPAAAPLLLQDKGSSSAWSLSNPCRTSPRPLFIPSGNQGFCLADTLFPEQAAPFLLRDFVPAACSPGRPSPRLCLFASDFPGEDPLSPCALAGSSCPPRPGSSWCSVLRVSQPQASWAPASALPPGGFLPPG